LLRGLLLKYVKIRNDLKMQTNFIITKKLRIFRDKKNEILNNTVITAVVKRLNKNKYEYLREKKLSNLNNNS